MAAVILSRPLCLLWQGIYLGHGQNITPILIAVSVMLNVLSLLVCVLLGDNNTKMFAAAAFVYSIISIAEIPVVYFMAVVLYPLIDTPSIFEAVARFPRLYYSGLFFSNIIITVCCLFSAHWLRKTQSKPPPKFSIFFSLLFILFALIVLVWWIDIIKITSISFLASALLATLLLGILLLLFYLYTRLIVSTDSKTGNYAQYIQHLSKRELEVVEALAAGNTSCKKLAAALNISVNTVKTHLQHIYQATGVSNIAALSSLFQGFTSNEEPRGKPPGFFFG